MPLPGSLRDGNQQDEDDDQDDDGHHLLALTGGTGDAADLTPGAVEAALVTVDNALVVAEHGDLVVELVADLHAQLALAADAGAEGVKLGVLVGHDLLVVRVDLHVGHVGAGDVVAVARGGVRVVAVGAEEPPRVGVGVGGGVRAGLRLEVRGCVGEADGLGGGLLGTGILGPGGAVAGGAGCRC